MYKVENKFAAVCNCNV